MILKIIFAPAGHECLAGDQFSEMEYLALSEIDAAHNDGSGNTLQSSEGFSKDHPAHDHRKDGDQVDKRGGFVGWYVFKTIVIEAISAKGDDCT